ncbi:MAG: protein-tyrosine phosphatase [Verrucomicrobiales bacterium]|jgi:protein-tyrosine phosphatase
MMSKTKPFRVLFVCMGNICRSPAGECVMRHLTEKAGSGELIDCDSAGTIDMHTGNQPDSRMRKAARGRGIEVAGAARQIKAADLDAFDLILAMDADNRAYIDRLKQQHGGSAELRQFCELCREHGLVDVPDPYYGGDDGFELVLDLLEDGCAALLDEIRRV